MSPETRLITRLLTALKEKDPETMASLYHPEATFRDEVFELKGQEIGAMWHMLCSRGKDMTLTFGDICSPEAGKVNGHWEPVYTYGKTGRSVHNRIDTAIEVRDGKIWKQTDSFSFWRWSSQALGIPGLILGWTPFLRAMVKRKANETLHQFIQDRQANAG